MFPLSRRSFSPFFAPEGDGGGGIVENLSEDLAVLNDEGGDDGDDPPETEDDQDAADHKKDLQVLEGDDDAGDDDAAGDDADDPDADADADADADKDADKDEPVIEGRPTVKQIKAVAPELFKRIPEMKNIFFREGQFSEVFSDPEEAKEAATYAGNYLKLEKSISQDQDPTLLLTELKQNNPDALKGLVTNWLPKLREIDQNLYIDATVPVIEELIFHAFKTGERTGDKNLAAAARHLSNYVFSNGGEIRDISKRAQQEEHPAEKKLKEEREQFAQQRFKDADQEINGRLVKTLEASIVQGLDPDNVLPERIKRTIIRDTIEELNATLLKDKTHGSKMASLWKRGQGDSFSRTSKDSIVNGYLQSVKPLLRSIRNRIRDEALGKTGKPQAPSKKTGEQPPQFKKAFGGSNRQGSRRSPASVLDPSKIDYRRTTDMDILMDNGGDRIKQRK